MFLNKVSEWFNDFLKDIHLVLLMYESVLLYKLDEVNVFSDVWPFSGVLMLLCLISVKIVFLCRPTYEFKKKFYICTSDIPC